jgi:hypothetical protein
VNRATLILSAKKFLVLQIVDRNLKTDYWPNFFNDKHKNIAFFMDLILGSCPLPGSYPRILSYTWILSPCSSSVRTDCPTMLSYTWILSPCSSSVRTDCPTMLSYTWILSPCSSSVRTDCPTMLSYTWILSPCSSSARTDCPTMLFLWLST